MMYSNHHMTTAGWAFSGLGMLIILGLIVVAIAWVVVTLRPGRDAASTSGRLPAEASLRTSSRSHPKPKADDQGLDGPPSAAEVSPQPAAPRSSGVSSLRR